MIILFSDNPDADPGLRTRHMDDHLEFLEANADAILAAGPLVDSAGAISGGLWLVEVSDSSEAKALVEADPFFPTGLRQGWEIRERRQVFSEGKRRI